ncbi:MAG: mechanosensitive ion channel family protein [Bacteroidetes bacterium]|nr:mechanosensitive ion channel family protein [Bacteroidota bacterium]
MSRFWNNIYFGNSISEWSIALAIIFLSVIFLAFIRKIFFNALKKWSSGTVTKLDDVAVLAVRKIVYPFLYFVAVYSGISYLTPSPKIAKAITVLQLIACTYFAVRLANFMLNHLINRYLQQHENIEEKRKQARGIIIVVNVLTWAIGLVFLADNLGYNVTALITGLGVGGIAIALAAQSILGDLFSYFIIFFDKPFEIGDFIIVDDKMGTIEYIGIKTTRVRTLSGDQLIFSNHDLTNSRVHNYKRMEKRRVVLSIGVTYKTSVQLLKKIPEIVKKIIEMQPLVTFDRGHFSHLGNYSLDFEFVYYVMSADYNLYMDKQQSINFLIMEKFRSEHIDFAYPTQTILVHSENVFAFQ